MKFTCIFLLLFTGNLFAQSFISSPKSVFEDIGNSSSIAFDSDNDGDDDILILGKSGVNYYSKLYRNNGDSTFLDLGAPVPGLAYGGSDVFDFNNDGLLDMVVCGSDGATRHFHVYKNLGNNQFSEITTTIPGVDYSAVKCSDINLDGLTDILLIGQSPTQKIFHVYRNNGDNTFTLANTLTGVYDGDIAITDINNDTYPDILVTGVDNSFELINKILINSGQNDFNFQEHVSNIPATRGGKITTIDIDNDGFDDVLVTGKDKNDAYITRLFKNNQGMSFTFFEELTGLYYSTVATGDFNNDGFSDLFLSGLDGSSTYKTIYYANASGSGFTEQATTLPNTIKGGIAPLNLTNDNKLDVFMCGYTMAGPVSQVFCNNIVASNSKPDTPANLSSIAAHDSVLLSWDYSNDNETASDGLTYAFYLKNDTEGDTVFSVPASFANGKRYINQAGILHGHSVLIRNLAYGKYSWSVQAIDQGYSGSAFAVEKEFNICHHFSLGNDTSMCYDDTISLHAGGTSDIVKWYTSLDPLTPVQSGNNSEFRVSGNILVWAEVTTPLGCTLTDTIAITAFPLPVKNMVSDTSICQNSNLSLTLYRDDYIGNWISESGNINETGNPTLNFQVTQDETIFVEITDSNSCINYDTIAIHTLYLPGSNLPSDTSGCINSILLLNAGTNSDSVYWYNKSGQLVANSGQLSHLIQDTVEFKLEVINIHGCKSFDSITIYMHPLPDVFAGHDTLICPQSSIEIGPSEEKSGYTYTWQPAIYLDDSTIANPKATPEESMEYVLTVTDNNSCTNKDSVYITVNSASDIDAGGNKFVCRGEPVMLGGDPTATGSMLPYDYTWLPENGLDNNKAPNPTILSCDSSTSYQLIVKTGDCIVDTLSVWINTLELPIINTSDDVVIGYQGSTEIWATGGKKYNWEPDNGLSNNAISNPVASPETTTLYTVHATDTNGCMSSSQVQVTIQNEIFVPNLFTPNDDGKNDFFLVYGTGIEYIHLKIFAPEGILVYETTDREEATVTGWDGKYNGKPLRPGKYLWIMEAISTDGAPMYFNGTNKGTITLLR
jgi:gliding motility-associated-like protein